MTLHDGWACISIGWFLPRALEDRPPRAHAPECRAVVLDRLDQVRRARGLPALAELGARLRELLVGLWGEVTLPYAPAFRAAG